MVADRSRLGATPLPAEPRAVVAQPLGRLMAALLGLVERLGWLRATVLCAIATTTLAVSVTAAVPGVVRGDVHGPLVALLPVALASLVLAGPGLAIALKLVEHLGRTRSLLLVEIDRRMVAEQQLRRLATTDDLTGLSNRRHFVERAREAIAMARRYDQWVTFVVVDVDRFKRINDRFGHAAGDRALIVLGTVLRANLRATDLAARFGGDEFVLLMPLTDRDAGLVAAERIRRAAREDVGDPPLSVSIGIAAAKGTAIGLEALMARADQALYDAKRTGRNRIGVCGSDTAGSGADVRTFGSGAQGAALPLKG